MNRFLRRLLRRPLYVTITVTPPAPYCVADYRKHSYRGAPACARCGAPDPRYTAPELPDLLTEARVESAKDVTR